MVRIREFVGSSIVNYFEEQKTNCCGAGNRHRCDDGAIALAGLGRRALVDCSHTGSACRSNRNVERLSDFSRTGSTCSTTLQGRSRRKIILTNDNLKSGWSEAEQRNPFYYERAKQELIQSGVPEQNIEVLMDPILGTYHEVCVIKLYCETHNIHSIVVVTSGYHSRRALFTLRKVFSGSETEVGMDPVAAGIDTPSPATWWYKSFGWQVVGQEYGKLLCYRLNLQ